MATKMQDQKLSFHDNLNILSLADEISTKLQSSLDHRASIEEDYERYQKISEKSHNASDRIRAKNALREIEKKLLFIRDGSLVSRYKEKVSPFLSEYHQLYGSSRVFGMDNCPNIPKRVSIILSFLKVTKDFLPIEWTCTYNMEKVCTRCHSQMRKCGSILVCDKCGYSRKIERMMGVHFIGNRIRLESTYDAAKNFRKEYLHLCGNLSELKEGEKEDIESYLYRAGIKEPKREHIREAIHACGYDNYHDVNYIFSLITREPLPDISDYIDICTQRFEHYFSVFQSLSDKEGKNITNIHFLIRLFLWQEGIAYQEDWFRSLAPSTENKHRRNAKKVCAILKTQDSEHTWNIPPSWG